MVSAESANSQPAASHKLFAFYCEIIANKIVNFPRGWTDLSLPGDHVVVPVVLVPADQGQLLPLSDVVGPQERIKDKHKQNRTEVTRSPKVYLLYINIGSLSCLSILNIRL